MKSFWIQLMNRPGTTKHFLAHNECYTEGVINKHSTQK